MWEDLKEYLNILNILKILNNLDLMGFVCNRCQDLFYGSVGGMNVDASICRDF